MSTYRTGNHNSALVYRYGDFTPADRGELVAVFVAQGGEHELDALRYSRAMNAEMPGCTCRVICCCGALVGSTSGCETCMEHNGECIGADLGELLGELAALSYDGQIAAADEAKADILRRFGWLGRYKSVPSTGKQETAA